MDGCDAWVELSKTPKLKFSTRPTCTWIQAIAHELAHIIDWVRTGDGVSHNPGFFRVYRRLLNLWFMSTETVQFVALERVICNPEDDLDEPNGPTKHPCVASPCGGCGNCIPMDASLPCDQDTPEDV
jgi:hypothetical protein